MIKTLNFIKVVISGIVIIEIMHLYGNAFFEDKLYQKEKIKSEEDVKVIKNPENPLFGELTFNLDLELSIDDKKVKGDGFYQISMIQVDYNDNLYILDTRKCYILKFDKRGIFLNRIGRKGQGPGEFENPSFFFVDYKQRIYVIDGRKLHIFESTGGFLKTLTMRHQLYNFFIDKDENIIALSHVIKDKGPEEAILKLDSGGKLIKEMVSFPSLRPSIRKDDKGKPVSLTVYHRYKYWIYLYPIDKEKFIYAHSSQYKLFKMKNDGVIELIVGKEALPKPIKRQEKELVISRIEERLKKMGKAFPRDFIKEACQFPPYLPFFDNIFVDEMGRIYVKKMKTETNENKEVEIDIFGKDGVYLYKTILPFSPAFLKNGYLYEIQISEKTGETKINKYKIKNWTQIKFLKNSE